MTLWILIAVSTFVAATFVGKLVVIFIQREQIPARPKHEPAEWPFISVIIPARNEEENIGRCAGSLLKQSYPADRYEVIVIDDDSDDRTPDILADLAAKHPMLKPIKGRPLPEGWFGKSNACAHGAEHAKGEFLFFLDADTWAEPEMLKAVTAFVIEREIDLLSLNPFQRMISPAERAILPGVFTAIATAMRFAESNTPGKAFAMASGQFMVFRRSAYDAVGGHGTVAPVLEEDMEFARTIKTAGFRLYWAFGDAIMNTRMYRDFAGIWEGFSKNLMKIMSVESGFAMALCAARFIALAWLPPITLALAWTCGACGAALAIAATVQGVLLILFLATVITLRVPIPYALAFPLGFTTHALMLIANHRKKKNRSITWKGRTFE